MRTDFPAGATASLATKRARRASEGANDPVAAPPLPEAEVPVKPARRRFTAEYKRRILKATDDLRESGQIGALLRREGLYSALLSKWRAQRDQGVLNALAPKKRGRKPAPHRPELARIAELERETETLRAQLQQAELIIDVQEKVASLLGVRSPDRRNEPNS